LRVEWWHFTSQDWQKYGPIRNVVFRTEQPPPGEFSQKNDVKPQTSTRKLRK
jgi:hypothetical protein